jgi:uncharacterized protein YbjT (DUF2867 family)
VTERSALVAGATGLVGGLCLDYLLEDPAFGRVIALARRPLERLHPRLAVVDSLGRLDFTGITDVFCALGATLGQDRGREAFRQIDLDYTVAIATKAAAAQARRFLVVSSVSASPRSPLFYLRVKAAMEAAVSSLPFDAVHIFRPGLLAGHRAEPRRAEQIGLAIARRLDPLLAGALRKYRSIPASTVAAAMVSAAKTDARGTRIHHWGEMQALAS